MLRQGDHSSELKLAIGLRKARRCSHARFAFASIRWLRAPMILDYLDPSCPTDIETDLCIVGSGAAGLSIARDFVGSGVRVCILESGGLGGEYNAQSLNDGTSIGDVKIDPATSRLRAFGGSCNLWGGGCIPLTLRDFEQRSWVPESGWPISFDALRPHYLRALAFCGVDVGKLDDGTSDFPLPLTPEKFGSEDLENSLWARSFLTFGKAYREDIARARNVSVLLHCNVLDLTLSCCGTRVDEARISAFEGRRGKVKARQFVLACGGIENARLLLLSNTAKPKGIGNDRDLVGRYFMDHPIVKLGAISVPFPQPMLRQCSPVKQGPGFTAYHEITLAENSQVQHQTLNCRVRAMPVEGQVPRGVAALRSLRSHNRSAANEDELVKRGIDISLRLPRLQPAIPEKRSIVPTLLDLGVGAGGVGRAIVRKLTGQSAVAIQHFDLFGFFEQAPNPDSRITLGDELDALGQRKVQIDWRLKILDWHTYRTTAKLFGEGLARHFSGRYHPEEWVSADKSCEAHHVRGAAHHLGTTRMSKTPATGVVDIDCLVHGIENLYIAGSSVFPCGGWAFPTLTIIALSLRLADHLRRRFAKL